MFDGSVPEPGQLAGLTAAELIDAATATARAENAACARKLAVMAEHFLRRTALAPEDRLTWWVDPDAAVTAELAAAHHITAGLALHQAYRAVVLRERLPKVGALFLAGLISDLLVRAIVNRTAFLLDTDLIAAVDADLAAEILGWGPLSVKKTDAAIDSIVERHDPDGVHRSRPDSLDRTVEFGQPGDAPGFSTIFARLFAGDTAAGQRTVTAMAYSVCDADPRTLDERRTDAFSALMHGITTLACLCGTSDCHAAANPRPLRDITVFAITDQTTRTDKPAPATEEEAAAERPSNAPSEAPSEPQSEAPSEAPSEDATEAEPATDEQAAAARSSRGASTTVARSRPAYLFGSGFMPATLFAAMLERGSTVRALVHPGQAGPECGRFPSRALAAFVRCRDLTCRFPGCDKPATEADIDHTVAHPVGPTHASNLKCLCRFHHLLKTYWGGPNGWRDRQHPDGTIVWTAPSGHTYTTHPGSRLLFPMLCLPTATLWSGDPPQVPDSAHKNDMMPRRTRPRAQTRTAYIAAQRLRNRTERLTHNALDNGEVPPPDYDFTTDPREYGNDPPPF